LNRKEIEELGVRFKTVINHKAVMEILCNLCEADCDKAKKTGCLHFSLISARQITDMQESKNEYEKKNIKKTNG